MKTKLLQGAVASLLLAGAGLASAAEPIALTDSQMDSVAAGTYPASFTTGAAAALVGFAASASTTSAVVTATSLTTSASSAAIAAGLLPIATTSAGSVIH